jgi:hypothetical protein
MKKPTIKALNLIIAERDTEITRLLRRVETQRKEAVVLTDKIKSLSYTKALCRFSMQIGEDFQRHLRDHHRGESPIVKGLLERCSSDLGLAVGPGKLSISPWTVGPSPMLTMDRADTEPEPDEPLEEEEEESDEDPD